MRRQMPTTTNDRQKGDKIMNEVYSYRTVKKIREKYMKDKEITIPEVRTIEKYVRIKKQSKENWIEGDKKQFLKADRLLQQLRKEKGMQIEVEH